MVSFPHIVTWLGRPEYKKLGEDGWRVPGQRQLCAESSFRDSQRLFLAWILELQMANMWL